MSVQGYKIDPNFLSTGFPCLLVNIITICLHLYPSEFMKLALLLKEYSVPDSLAQSPWHVLRQRDPLIWHRCPALLFCSCAGGSLLLSLEKAYDTKEAPDVDFTACIHIWDCALMTVGCPTHTFSSNRHYFTHISLFIFPFPEPWHRSLSLSDCYRGGESKMKLIFS